MEKQFLEKIDSVHQNILEGQFDDVLKNLDEALDFYETNDLSIEIPNIFEGAVNFIGGISDSALLLSALHRIGKLSENKNLELTRVIYMRYYALAHALFGAPDIGLKIIEEIEPLIHIHETHYVDLMNVKGIVFSKLERHEEAVETYLENFELAKRLNYTRGEQFVSNVGFEYHYLDRYDKAIEYLKLGMFTYAEAKNEFQLLQVIIELAEVYFLNRNYDLAKRTIKKVKYSEVLTQNQKVYLHYCLVMYKLSKHFGKFEDALYYLEIIKDLEIQLNMDFYTSIIKQHDREMDQLEDSDYKHRNYELEVMSDKLRNTNSFLKSTLAKSHEMQQELYAKNQELEATMESLNNTQDRLLVAEKRNVLDSMFINIANHMNTPLGVMNTATSHVKNISYKTSKKFHENELSKSVLVHHFEELDKTIALYEESLNQVIGFVDTLKLYKTKEGEEIVEVDLKSYLESVAYKYKRFKGVEDIGIICHENARLLINTSLFEKCVDLVSNKLLINSKRNGFDIEVSNESSMISIGIGDFTSKQDVQNDETETSLVDSYDFYIIQTIVENLLNGRFIKFNDRGRDYFQFIFRLES